MDDRDGEMLKNYRGRRYLICTLINDIGKVIDHLGEEDGTQLPIPGTKFPEPPSQRHKDELHNLATVLLRQVIQWNDGGMSPHRLQRF
jgi:hypothetical protein